MFKFKKWKKNGNFKELVLDHKERSQNMFNGLENLTSVILNLFFKSLFFYRFIKFYVFVQGRRVPNEGD